MNIIITGGTGLLGRYLIRTKPPEINLLITHSRDYRDNTIPNTTRVMYYQIDVCDYNKQLNLFTLFEPDLIIHAAGIGSPDYAETHRDETRWFNVGGALIVSQIAMKLQCPLIYISSNGIYSGSNPPYNESSQRYPVNYYGNLKKYTENILQELVTIPVTIIRPTLMYGNLGEFEPFARKNIVLIALGKLREGKTIHCYDNIYCKPLYAGQCAEAIWKIIERGVGKSDKWNIAGGERCSILDLVAEAATTFEVMNGDLYYEHHVPAIDNRINRPLDTSFDTTKMETVLNIKPLSIIEGLEKMKNED